MASAAAYLKLTTYENEVVTALKESVQDMTIGIKCTTTGSGYWAIFDDFRLFYYGTMSPETVTDIDLIEVEESSDYPSESNGIEVYNLQGVKVAEALEDLPRGIYIVNRKKVLVR
jgi:hypothetical protein